MLVEALSTATVCVAVPQLFVLPEGVREPGIPYMVSFGRLAQPAPLRAKAGGPSGLMLDIRHWFVIAEDDGGGPRPLWRARTSAYEYRILDSQETELLVFHWQPGSAFSGPDFPHLHVSAALSAQVSATFRRSFPLDKRHVPTGPISLAAVVRLLIAEFGVADRHRAWPTRLLRAEEAFRSDLAEIR